MKIRGLIDDKKKKRVQEAIARGDPSLLWPKKKAEPEPIKKTKAQLSPDEQERENSRLIDAVFNLDTEVVAASLRNGADPNADAGIYLKKDGGTALTLVVKGWYREKNRTVIDKPENWRQKQAVLEACRKIIELLVTNGADPNASYDGRPVLEYLSGDRRIYELLKRYGARE